MTDAVNAGAVDATAGLLGTGTLLAQGTSIPMTGLMALTDGFAVAKVVNPDDNQKLSVAYAGIHTIGWWFDVTGGSVGSFGAKWKPVMFANLACTTIPIPQNTTWYYMGWNDGGNQQDSRIQIFWFPMGRPQSGDETYRALTAEEARDAPPPARPPE